MKKSILTLCLSICSALSLHAMSYEEASQQALFLTDKMAYELNLNQQQYEDCYEINLDYLLGVTTPDDVYGTYLQYRNADLRHILYDWQYSIFAATDYFLHPLYWSAGVWTYPIYRHYNAGYFYYSRPAVFAHYRGGHGRYYYSGGYYLSRRPHWNGGLRGMDRGRVHRGYGAHHGGGRGYHVGTPNHGGHNGGHVGSTPQQHGTHGGRGGGYQSNYSHSSSTRTNPSHSMTPNHSTAPSHTHSGRGGGYSGNIRSSSVSAPSHGGGSHHGGGFGGSSRGGGQRGGHRR